MKRLPLGMQDFPKIREGGYFYIDKTDIIHRLLTGSGQAFFLSRPRRFGKSLLCSTLGAIFEGRRELFTNLAIDKLAWEWKKHPVIRIDLNPGNYTKVTDELLITINHCLAISAEKYDIPLTGDSVADRFQYLIEHLHQKLGEKVAVIIDEYDKPLLNSIDNRELHIEIRNILKSFYGVLKSSDGHLRFVFLTGVAKFSKISVFSDLNNLIDLSFDDQYGTLCGLTQKEVESNFAEEIEDITQKVTISRGEYLLKLKRFYNGYRFSEDPTTVYNPFGLLYHFYKHGRFNSYWFATGTPTFLIKLIENQHIDILNLEKRTIALNDFHKFDADNMEAVPVLYQAGYLTIVAYDEEFENFTLDYPNEEVRSSFADALVEHYAHVPASDTRAMITTLPRTLSEGDIDAAMNALKVFFASIPYDIQIKQEKYYQTIVHLIFRMLGLNCQSEVKIATGRIDTLVETKSFVYCFEFKLKEADGSSGTAEEALKQIDSKEYLLPWMGSGKKLVKVGVSFDYEKWNIGEWKAGGDIAASPS